MSTNTPLNRAQHRPDSLEIRRKLEAQLEARYAQIAKAQLTVIALTGQSDVDSLLERELAEAALDVARRVLADNTETLENLERFGRCRSCGEMIPLERLEAIPHTTVCVTCSAPIGAVLN